MHNCSWERKESLLEGILISRVYQSFLWESISLRRPSRLNLWEKCPHFEGVLREGLHCMFSGVMSYCAVLLLGVLPGFPDVPTCAGSLCPLG